MEVVKNRTFWLVFITSITSILYAYVRYNIVRDVAIANLPLFIGNKAISLTATILIGISFLLGPLTRFWPNVFEKQLSMRKSLGLWGFGLASIHAIASLVLISPEYYPRFYSGGKMTLQAESFILFGILAFIIFFVISLLGLPGVEKNMDPTKWKFVQRMGYLAYLFVLLHVFILGFSGWFRPDSWRYGLASISLISSLFIILVLLIRVVVLIFPKKK